MTALPITASALARLQHNWRRAVREWRRGRAATHLLHAAELLGKTGDVAALQLVAIAAKTMVDLPDDGRA